MLNLDLLNLYAADILSGNLLENYQAFEGLLDDSVQIESSDTEVFNLKPLCAGQLKTVENTVIAPENKIAVLRIPLGYNSVLKIQENKNKFNFLMHNLTNKALGAFTRKLGNISFYTVVAERPGQPGKFFTDLQDAAAIEIRFVARYQEKK